MVLKRFQLCLRFLFGFRSHPFQVIDARRERLLQIADERVHPLFGFRLEMAFDIRFADKIADRVLDGIDAALPPRLLLVSARAQLMRTLSASGDAILFVYRRNLNSPRHAWQ